MFDEFQQTAKTIFETAQQSGTTASAIPTPPASRPWPWKSPRSSRTKYGSIYADSEPMSRAARFTKNNVDSRFGQAERELLEQAQRALAERRDRLDRRGGRATAPRGSPPG